MPSPTYRDRDAFTAIVAALSATGEFATVVFGQPADLDVIGANLVPAVVLMPVEWVESPDARESAIRHVTYTLTLLVRDEDSGERFAQLERMTALAQNVLDGSDLGGCIPALSRLRSGRYELGMKRAEGRATIAGTFSYIVPAIGGRASSA